MEYARSKLVHISTPDGEEIPYSPIVQESAVREVVASIIMDIRVGERIDPRMIQARLFNGQEIDCPMEVLIPLIAEMRCYVVSRMLDASFAVFFERRNG